MKTIVIGVGNLVRRDDGAGIHVVNRLKDKAPWIEAVDAAMGSVEILEAMKGYDRVIIVDAVRSGAEPGQILNIDVKGSKTHPSIYLSHGIDVVTTLRLGEKLFSEEMPKEQTIIGIEVEDILEYGVKCTPKVERSIERVVDEIISLSGGVNYF